MSKGFFAGLVLSTSLIMASAVSAICAVKTAYIVEKAHRADTTPPPLDMCLL